MWKFDKIISVELDKSDKYIVKYLLDNGKEKEGHFQKYLGFPTEENIKNNADKIINNKNNPPEKLEPPVLDDSGDNVIE